MSSIDGVLAKSCLALLIVGLFVPLVYAPSKLELLIFVWLLSLLCFPVTFHYFVYLPLRTGIVDLPKGAGRVTRSESALNFYAALLLVSLLALSNLALVIALPFGFSG